MASDSKVYEVITSRIIDLLEKGVVPWRKPWKSSTELPMNLITKIPYRGINIFLLNSMPFSSPYWLSYNQTRKLGGRIIDKELRNSTPVIFFKWYEINNGDKEDKEAKDLQLLNQQQNSRKKKIPYIRYYRVYNTEQCTGLEHYIPEIQTNRILNPIQDCETIIEHMFNKPGIIFGGDKAFYNPRLDIIYLPHPESFNNVEDRYCTEFHELIHSTGHEKRLNRRGVSQMHAFGDEVYSLEELVAEMGASFLCAMTGIENKTINNSVGYISTWLEELKNDPKMVVIAGAQAQKACDYILYAN